MAYKRLWDALVANPIDADLVSSKARCAPDRPFSPSFLRDLMRLGGGGSCSEMGQLGRGGSIESYSGPRTVRQVAALCSEVPAPSTEPTGVRASLMENRSFVHIWLLRDRLIEHC